ncbi:MAG: hypothetical protein K2M78_07020 [Lachnospiraceae bacterium]|nr:hypothetical protein [Lachnospiraceae bacterium]
MRTLITEYKRMFFEKRIFWLIAITVIYVTVCSLFWNLRFKLDYGYFEISYKQSAFKLWQDIINEIYVRVLMKIIPCIVCVFSFMDDRKNGIDNQICIRNHSNIYYMVKYVTVITGGMLYNFLSVILIYVPLYFLLATGDDGWNYLDRYEAYVGKFFNGNTAVEFVLIIAVCYAFVGGVYSAMSYVISMWIDNRVLVCIMPYIICEILQNVLYIVRQVTLANTIFSEVDVYMADKPFIHWVHYFVLWILFLSILLIISYTINIKNKK